MNCQTYDYYLFLCTREGYFSLEFYIYVFVLVLKLLKMAKGIRALLDTVIQALPQVGNLVN